MQKKGGWLGLGFAHMKIRNITVADLHKRFTRSLENLIPIKKGKLPAKRVFGTTFPKAWYGNPLKFLRGEPGLQPGSKELRSYLEPRFLPSVGLPPPNLDIACPNFPAFGRASLQPFNFSLFSC